MNDPIENKELELTQVYKKAKKRVHFKIHLGFYLLILLFLWLVWFFIFKNNSDQLFFKSILFLTLAWSLVLIGHFLYSYKWNNTLVENEIKNLLKERKGIKLSKEEIAEIVNSKEKKQNN